MALFVVQASGQDLAALEKAIAIQDSFSKPAFLFAELWLLYNRLWVPFLVWIILEGSYVAFVAPHVTLATSIFVNFLAHLYIGFEGNRLRVQRDAAVNDIIEARDRDEAETIFFRRQLAEPASP